MTDLRALSFQHCPRGSMPSAPTNEVVTHCGTKILVDHEDVDRLSTYKWYMRGGKFINYPAARVNGPKMTTMHRLIMLAPVGIWIDHINGNPLDNRKSNLRYCNSAQNSQNKFPRAGCASKYKGVRFHKGTARWEATIKAMGRSIYLGLFFEQEDAARAYDAAAILHFGEFARTNASVFHEIRSHK